MTPRARSIFAADLLLLAFGLAIAAAYIATPFLPVSFGWENGVVENAQLAVLFCGGALAALRADRALAHGRQKMFWLILTPVWFLLFAQELSWGAVLQPAIDFSFETGPVFSSASLAYKPFVAPVAAAILAICVFAFFKTRQHHTVATLWHVDGIPLVEFAAFAACLMVSASAEGHGLFDISHLGEASAQVFEELAELCAYIALVCAQLRVARRLVPPSSPVNITSELYRA